MTRKVEEESVLSIETDQTVNEKDKEDEKKKKKKNEDEGDRDFLMVATTFIAAMAFQAGTNPPGGVWQDDNNKPDYEAGKSIMATKSPSQFISFMSGVTLCFACSVMQFMVLLVKSSAKTWSVSKSFLYFTMGSAISSMIVAYWSAIKALTPDAQMSSVIVMLKTTLVLSIVLLPISMYIEKRRLASR